MARARLTRIALAACAVLAASGLALPAEPPSGCADAEREAQALLDSGAPEASKPIELLVDCLRRGGKAGEEYAAARPLFERALAAQAQALGPEHPAVARTLNDLAGVLADAGDPAAASPLCVRGLVIRQKSLGPDHPDVEESLTTLARILAAGGDAGSAQPLLERALRIVEKVYGPDSPRRAQILYALARERAIQGEPAAAFDQALEAERISSVNVRLFGDAAARPPAFDLALTLLARGLDVAARRRALDVLVHSRALLVDELAARQRALAVSDDAEATRLAQAHTRARERLAELVQRGRGDDEPEDYRRRLDEARDEEEKAQKLLAGASTAFARELSRSNLGLGEVAASLPEGSALVSFAEFRRLDLAPAYLALVLRAAADDPAVVDLGPAAPIDAALARWSQEAGRPGPEAAYREVGAALRRSVWDPLGPALGDADRVFVIPDGTLRLLSIATLPADDGGYLVERLPVVHYASAERDLVRAGWERHGKGLLALSLPPATAQETRDLVRLWRDHGPATSAAASESALQRSAPGHRALHLATPVSFLTAEAIAALDLSDVEWVVLSARDSLLAAPNGGEALFGLQRAFQLAGAATWIVSLWPSDDAATRAWTRALYEGRLEQQLDTAEAARRASLSVLRERRKHEASTHPFYWGAFVASGDWR